MSISLFSVSLVAAFLPFPSFREVKSLNSCHRSITFGQMIFCANHGKHTHNDVHIQTQVPSPSSHIHTLMKLPISYTWRHFDLLLVQRVQGFLIKYVHLKALLSVLTIHLSSWS